MRWLAIPKVSIEKGQVIALIQRYRNMNVIGIWFMSIFAKAAWLETIFFDMMICATIDPVTAT